MFVDDEQPTAAPSLELEDVVLRPTLRLRKEDVLYLQSEQILEAFPSRRARDLHVLLRISTAIGAIRNAEDLQLRLIELLFDAMPTDCAAIFLSENNGTDFSSSCARGRTPGVPLQMSRTVLRQVIAEGDAVVSNDVAATDAFAASESLIRPATRSLLCAPFIVSERLRGAIYLASSDPSARFDEGHLELAVGIAGLTGVALQNIQHIERLERETKELRTSLTIEHSMVGDSAAMRQVHQLIARVAPSDSTILISGESGTGKELSARAIHRNSVRAHRSFLVINAAAIPETWLETELFGHEKGAFTGAIGQKRGQLELADGGTVFFDEIGELAPSLQVKLLRVLQEREFTRIGGTRPIAVDVRFLAATNRDLRAAVNDGTFRQDLYDRLNVVSLRMPPLRERREDIPLLASFFLSRTARSASGAWLAWPKTRESACCNMIGRAISASLKTRSNAPSSSARRIASGSTTCPKACSNARHLGRTLPPVTITRCMLQSRRSSRRHWSAPGGNRAEAARQLGLHPNNLHRLIRNLNLKDA